MALFLVSVVAITLCIQLYKFFTRMDLGLDNPNYADKRKVIG